MKATLRNPVDHLRDAGAFAPGLVPPEYFTHPRLLASRRHKMLIDRGRFDAATAAA
jgi:hypothetical protein